MDLLVTAVMASLLLGLLYGLFGVGMGLTLRASGTLNLAHGDMLMLATYVAVGTAGLSGPVPVVVTVAVAVALAWLAYQGMHAPTLLARGSALRGLAFLPALGVALLARAVAQWLFPTGSTPVGTLLPGRDLTLPTGVRLPADSWWLLAAGVLVPLAVYLLLHRTGMGMRIRAVSDDPVLASVTGISVRRTLAVAYLAAGAVGGLAGALYASVFDEVFTGLGWQATLKGFTAVVLGGLGHVRGAMLGGLLLGVAEAFTAAFLSSTYRDVISYLILIAVLVVGPRGLAAGRAARTV